MTTPEEVDKLQELAKETLIEMIENKNHFITHVRYNWLDGDKTSVTFEYIDKE